MSQTPRTKATEILTRDIAAALTSDTSGTVHEDGRGYTVADLVGWIFGGDRDYEARAARIRRALAHMQEDLAVEETVVCDDVTGGRKVKAYTYKYGHLDNY